MEKDRSPPDSRSTVTCLDSCITQLKAHGPSRTCDESKEEEEECSEPCAERFVPELFVFVLRSRAFTRLVASLGLPLGGLRTFRYPGDPRGT